MPDVSNLLEIAKQLGGIITLVFYASIVLWTYKDARRRVDDPILVATAVAASMLPIVGVLVYILLRPPEYLADVRERELEIKAMERTLGRQERCPHCRSHIEGNYLSCPICMSKLRQSCLGCDKPLDPRWAMCPFCETEVVRPAAGETPGRPGRSARTEPRAGGRNAAQRGSGTKVPAAKTPATKAPAKRGSSSAGRRPATTDPVSDPLDAPRPPREEPDTGNAAGSSITTEPFQSLGIPRFVRSDKAPVPAAPRITSEHATMIHPGPKVD